MKRAPHLLALALLLPGTALAQTIAVTLDSASSAATSGTGFPFHQLACTQALAGNDNTYNQIEMTWPISTTITYQAFWSTDSTCDATTAADGGNTNIPFADNGTEEEATINGETILSQVTGNGSNPCTATPYANGTVYLCVTGTESDGLATNGEITLTPFDLAFQFDMAPPPASTGVQLTSADSELDVAFNFPYTAPPVFTGTTTNVITDTGDNADHFIIYAQEDDTLVANFEGQCSLPVPDGGEVDSGAEADGGSEGIVGTTVDPTGWPIQLTVPTPSSENNSASISGNCPGPATQCLTNNHCYDVSIIAFYPDGTQGIATPVSVAAPIEIFDYWRLYHQAGGLDQGGLHCQSAGGGLLPLAIVLALLVVLRRRRSLR